MLSEASHENIRHLAFIRDTHARGRKRNKRSKRTRASEARGLIRADGRQSCSRAVRVRMRVSECSPPTLSFSIGRNHPPSLPRPTQGHLLPPYLPPSHPPSIRHSVCSLNSLTNDSGGGDAAPATDPTPPPPSTTPSTGSRRDDGRQAEGRGREELPRTKRERRRDGEKWGRNV